MYIIGTAGHVDHGKSTLIEAITGTHPDRLKEERDREMSIVLGFDSFTLPDGKGISIVDVPGHRDFIENMLSGISGIDACLFVIAADEGVMPQTREHLAILDLLEVGTGVIALTKVDLVNDQEWLDLVEAEIEQLVAGTTLKNAPIQRVSAKTKEGIPELLDILGGVLETQNPRVDLGRPRLSVDRIFSMPGFGSVVTGTLKDGQFKTGDEVIVLPSGNKGRIRGLQAHNQDVDEVGPGRRTAVNISGIETKLISRGDVVVHPGDYSSTRRLDVSFRFLPDIEGSLRHNMETKLFLGADEVISRVRLLGVDFLKPGETAWLQLEVEKPVVALRGDRFILRRPSPSETLGGGIVLDPHPPYRHKRFDDAILDQLEALSGGEPSDVLLQAMTRFGAGPVDEVLKVSGLEEDTAREIMDQLVKEKTLILVGKGKNQIVTVRSLWEDQKKHLLDMIIIYHKNHPLRSGMPREELKSQMRMDGGIFDRLVENLIQTGEIFQEGPVVSIKGFKIAYSSDQEKKIKELMAQFKANPTQPPSVKECREAVGEEIYKSLVDGGELLQVSSEVVFTPEIHKKMVADVQGKITKDGPVTVAQVRDLLGSSRKYVLAFLENLDAEGVTVREGDVRRLKSSGKS
jgi:selenocysteine-specific elongation factor